MKSKKCQPSFLVCFLDLHRAKQRNHTITHYRATFPKGVTKVGHRTTGHVSHKCMCLYVWTLGLSVVWDRKLYNTGRKRKWTEIAQKYEIIISFGDQDYNSFGNQSEQGRKEEQKRKRGSKQMVEAEMEVRPCSILTHVTLYCVLLQERFQNIFSSKRSPIVLVKTGSMSYSLSTSGKIISQIWWPAYKWHPAPVLLPGKFMDRGAW